MKVAVFGSRKGVTLERVGTYLSARAGSSAIVVSGGAPGVDHYAEQTWLALGGRVWSLRPIALGPEEYGVEFWDIGGDSPRVFPLRDHPTFATYAGACIYRDMLIAEWADRGVAFRAGKSRSRGTSGTIEFLGYQGKPCAVYDEEDQDEPVT